MANNRTKIVMKKLNDTYLILSPDKLNIVYNGVFGTKTECVKVQKTLAFPCVVETLESYQNAVNSSVIKPRQK